MGAPKNGMLLGPAAMEGHKEELSLASPFITLLVHPESSGLLGQASRPLAPTGLEGIWDGKPANGFEPMVYVLLGS
jgi:hypothetical protein